MKNISIRLIGTGSGLPQKVVSNEELAKTVDTSDEWIVSRTGIRQRYVCGEGESTATLAHAAARQAMEEAGVQLADLDAIVVATTSPDMSFPGVSSQVHQMLGGTASAQMVFDVQAACNGFLSALSSVEAFMHTGKIKTALVIGADAFSKLLDWSDRSTCVLFGDGAGAVVLRAEKGDGQEGLLDTALFHDGEHVEDLRSSGGVATTQTAGVLKMNGREVFRHAVRQMSAVAPVLLARNGLAINDIDWLVPHQANRRILEATAEALGLPESKVVITVDRHANTSAASIPLALATAARENTFKKGDLLLMQAFGAGFAWGGALLRW